MGDIINRSFKKEVWKNGKSYVVARVNGRLDAITRYSKKTRMKDYYRQYQDNRTFRKNAKRLKKLDNNRHVYEYSIQQPKEAMPRAPHKKFAYLIQARLKGEDFGVSSRYDYWPSVTDAYNEAYQRYYSKLGSFYNANHEYDESEGIKHLDKAKIVWEGVRYYEAARA